jgi:hypothetical protein
MDTDEYGEPSRGADFLLATSVIIPVHQRRHSRGRRGPDAASWITGQVLPVNGGSAT